MVAVRRAWRSGTRRHEGVEQRAAQGGGDERRCERGLYIGSGRGSGGSRGGSSTGGY
jgi:hypothetical protein